jgi:hypothetical protein
LRQYSFAKKFQSQTVIREKFQKTLSCKKGTHKMLMKLTPSYRFGRLGSIQTMRDTQGAVATL